MGNKSELTSSMGNMYFPFLKVPYHRPFSVYTSWYVLFGATPLGLRGCGYGQLHDVVLWFSGFAKELSLHMAPEGLGIHCHG